MFCDVDLVVVLGDVIYLRDTLEKYFVLWIQIVDLDVALGDVIYWYSQTGRPVHKLRFPLSLE